MAIAHQKYKSSNRETYLGIKKIYKKKIKKINGPGDTMNECIYWIRDGPGSISVATPMWCYRCYCCSPLLLPIHSDGNELLNWYIYLLFRYLYPQPTTLPVSLLLSLYPVAIFVRVVLSPFDMQHCWGWNCLGTHWLKSKLIIARAWGRYLPAIISGR